MRLQRIIEQVYCRPWLCTPTSHAAIRKLIESKLAGSRADLGIEDMFVQREPLRMTQEGVAVIYIFGVLGLGLSPLEKTCGNTDTADIVAEIQQAQQMGARAFLFTVNSPGGMVVGTPELGDAIAGIKQPTAVFTNSMIASAAYWVSAGANRIFSTRSAEIGSIGVYIPWVDTSAAWDQKGYKADPIISQNADLKAIGFGPSLSDAQREYLQQEVNQTEADFRAHIAEFRQVDPLAMRGQTLDGKRALAAGLVDQIGTIDDAINYLLSRVK